jgi:hypothetical protein
MACEAEQQKFKTILDTVQGELETELKAIAASAEAKATELTDKYKDGSDLAQGVFGAAGTVVGGVFGSEPGAAAGHVVGKAIGALFVMEVREERKEVSLDLPEFSVRDERWSFDWPEVRMKDNDIIFNVPTMVMRRVEGPPIPRTVVRMVTECRDLGWPIGKICTDVPQTTVEWEKTYLDMPHWENREQRIVIGIPEIAMRRQEVVVGVPKVEMKRVDMSFTVPVVVMKFAQDAGKDLADDAAKIAAEASVLTTQKQAEFKHRMAKELVPAAKVLFDCHKGGLLEKRKEVEKFFDAQIDTVVNSIIVMKSNGVPDADPNLTKAQAQADTLRKTRTEQLKQFDDALAKLDEAMVKQIKSMIGEEGMPTSKKEPELSPA